MFTPVAGMTLTCTRDRVQSPTEGATLQGDTFVLERQLGSGSFGEVWRCTEKFSGETRAVKILHDSIFPNAVADAEYECGNTRRVLQSADVVHVPNFYGMAEADLRTKAGDMVHRLVPVICMEFIDGRSLSSIVSYLYYKEACISAIIADVARALERLHKAGIIHNDVKPQNVLVDRSGKSYLCDFGITLFKEEWTTQSRMPLLGSPYYLAPEVANSSPCRYDEKVDVWALGVLTYEMLAGHPWLQLYRVTTTQFIFDLLATMTHINLKEVEDASNNILRFLSSCLVWDPLERPSAAQCLQHSFLSAVDRGGSDPRDVVADFMHAHLTSTTPRSRPPAPAESTIRPRWVKPAVEDADGKAKGDGKEADGKTTCDGKEANGEQAARA